jgi:hypothetical protein
VSSAIRPLHPDPIRCRFIKIINKRGYSTRQYRQKNDEVALLALAKKYQWPLKFYSAAKLAKVDAPNPSAG